MRFSLIYAVFPVILVLLQIIAFAFFGNRTRPSARDLEEGEDDGIPDGVTAQTRELFAKICDAMESSRLYLNPDLRMEDLISVCGSNRSYISGCINQVTGLSFPEFVNSYRVHYAQMLLSEGYLPVIETEPPEAPEGYYYVSGWEQQGDQIVQIWTLEELPPEPDELTPDEALDIILGGAE